MKFPITVNEIKFETKDHPIRPGIFHKDNIGKYVAIRPCSDDKTYLGIYLGDLHHNRVQYDPKTETLIISQDFLGNPSIWVPDLNRIVQGYESWWGIISSETQLKDITDKDINNVWYVKALKQIEESSNAAG